MYTPKNIKLITKKSSKYKMHRQISNILEIVLIVDSCILALNQ